MYKDSKLKETLDTKVVHVLKSTFDVYIGRGSPWGSPYHINIDGTREEVICKYEEYLRNRPELLAKLPNLKGKILGCHCKPLPCHGDILIKLMKERGI